MKIKHIQILSVVIFLLCANFVFAQENPVISAMKKEITRNKSNLKIDKLKPPFFINYTIFDNKELIVSASLGSLVNSMNNDFRAGIPYLLVGDYNRNNINFRNRTSARYVTVENSDEGIATPIWSDLDMMYKNAAENYEAKVAAIAQQNLDEEDLNLPDLDKTTPTSLILEPAKVNSDKAYWEDYAKKSSAIFKKYPEILESGVNINIRNSVAYICNTENTQIVMPAPYYSISLQLFTITDDGQELNNSLYFEHTTFEQMPNLQKFMDTCEIVAKKFIALRNAPMLKEAYSGPVLFEGQAVPEALQSQIHTLIASRKPVVGPGGNNIEMMKDKKLISRSLTIKSLSGTETYKGKKLDGYYPVDAEGVAPDKELVLIEKGVLKNMLNGRAPTKKFPHSNGHSRINLRSFSTGVMPGNLQLTSSVTYNSSEMKKKLLEAAKEEDLDYAYIVRGFRGNQPFEIYRVYVNDGREELVRGAAFQDFNLKSFKRVLGTSNREFFYNTNSFGSLVTYIVPDAILFEELDVTRNTNITLKTPFIVPRPTN